MSINASVLLQLLKQVSFHKVLFPLQCLASKVNGTKVFSLSLTVFTRMLGGKCNPDKTEALCVSRQADLGLEISLVGLILQMKRHVQSLGMLFDMAVILENQLALVAQSVLQSFDGCISFHCFWLSLI